MDSAVRLLVADDDVDMLELLRRTLTREGFEVVPVSSGAEALAILRRDSRFGLMISDARMPPMDLEQLLPAVREVAPDLKIIVISGYSELEGYLRHTREGAYAYVAKPFKIPDLLEVIDRALGRSESAT